MQAGFWSHKDYDPVPTEERDRLAIKASQGDQESKDKLVKSCIRFAVNRSMKWAKRNPQIPLDDFIQEACFGLVEASNAIDLNRGKFLTCATLYIDKNLKRLYGENTLVRLPWHARWNYKGRTEITDKAAKIAKRKTVDIRGFDIPIDYSHEDSLDSEYLAEKAKQALMKLDDHERSILIIRYLSEDDLISSEAIGKKLGKHRSTIDINEVKALKRMRELMGNH